MFGIKRKHQKSKDLFERTRGQTEQLIGWYRSVSFAIGMRFQARHRPPISTVKRVVAEVIGTGGRPCLRLVRLRGERSGSIDSP